MKLVCTKNFRISKIVEVRLIFQGKLDFFKFPSYSRSCILKNLRFKFRRSTVLMVHMSVSLF